MPACAVEDGRLLTGDFGTDFEMLRELFRLDGTFRFREVRAGAGMRCALLYLDGMVNNELIYNAVIRPLLLSEPAKGDPAQWLLETALYAGDVKAGAKVRDLLRALLYGDSVLLVEGAATALLINTKGFRTRGISEPENEAVQKGPREGFDEVAMLNLSQLRRRLQTPDLAVEVLRVGRRTDTMVFVCYLASLARPRLVREVRRRLEEISIDGILDANYIAELTRDHAFSLFETTGSSERPDVIASKLLEGRVALIVDGTPVVLTVPYLFCENFQSDEDYYQSFWVSSVGRLLRYVSFFLTVSVPALYLALLTHHTRLLPTFLLLSAAQSRAGVPFSSLTECLALIVILELLGETGARMPQQLGHTLSIVGGLVVGQAAVEARLVSAPMLIVVALSGIAGLMVPRLRGAVLYARVGMVLLAAVLGLPGCFLGLTVIAVRLMGLSSYGVPYLSPLEHPDLQGLKDTAWRLPWRFMRTRPAFSRNSVRQRGANGVSKMHKNSPRRVAALLCVCTAALSLFSCRGLRGQEPEQGALVAAIGIDAEEAGVRISLEVLVPREGDEAERLVLEAVGATASEAYGAALSGFPRAPLFGHCAVMVFGDGVSDAALADLLSEDSLPPEMQVVTAPDAAALLALGGLSTPAMGYDLQAMLSGDRTVHCRVYELTEGNIDRAALPRFSPAPKGSGKTVLSEFPKSGAGQAVNRRDVHDNE